MNARSKTIKNEEDDQFLTEVNSDVDRHLPILRKKFLEAQLERNFNLLKLRHIEKFGESKGWADESAILREIKQYFDSLNLANE